MGTRRSPRRSWRPRARPTAGSSMAEQPVFFYDFYAPYSYLAAERVNSVLPVVPEWRPISFGHILQKDRRTPWSLERDAEWHENWEELRRRAAQRGLPEVTTPDGCHAESTSL